MSMSGGASDNVVSVIEDAVHKVWPEYKFPLTKEQDATLTHEQSVAVSDELCNLRATIDDFPLVCDEAVLHGEYIAFGAWLRAQTTGSGMNFTTSMTWKEANTPNFFVQACGGYIGAEWLRTALWR